MISLAVFGVFAIEGDKVSGFQASKLQGESYEFRDAR